MTSTETTPLDSFLPFLLRQLTTALNSAMTRDLKPYGVNVPRWRVLAVLSTRDHSTIADLTRLTFLSQPGVSQVVEQLEAEDLIRRLPDPTDNRYQKISLTGKGRKLLERVIPIALEYQQRLTEGFDEAEKEIALKLCKRMLENIS